MDIETRFKLRSKARMARGFMSILDDDIKRIYNGIEDSDLIDLEESIRDAKETLQCLIDDVMELDYIIYLSKR